MTMSLLLRTLAASLALATAVAGAQVPSQSPLLSRSGASVKPNVMLTLDDSGSMGLQYMPEGTVHVGSWTVSDFVRGAYVRFHPADNGPQASIDAGMLVAGVPGAMQWKQRFLRSSDTNTIYYNPAIRYRPWVRSDGTRYPNATLAKVQLDPLNASSGAIDLSQTYANLSANWCYRPTEDACRQTPIAFDPGLYYRLRQQNGQYLDPTQAGNYDEFSVNTGSSFTKYPDRGDCAGSSCTQSEERQNFANWFVYYRSRLLLAKGAIAEAFVSMDDSFRLGWGKLSQPPSSFVDTVPNLPVVVQGVRDFASTHRQAFLDWLYAVPKGGTTPLRLAMQSVGDYYAANAAAGPWSDTPGRAGGGAPKSCRRAYHVLVTDGYWSDTDGSALRSVGNVDGSAAARVTSPDGRSFAYAPSRPYMDSYGNQLADYAMKYWLTDLQPGIPNKVQPTPGDPAFWQHMTTFTVGLGVRGTLDPAQDLAPLVAGTKSWGNDHIDDLWHAALNSRGEFFSAQDPSELATAIRSAIRSSIERELREAGAATAALVLQAGNRKYVPRYKTTAWSGDVEAYVLDDAGQGGVLMWSAKDKLPAWADRNIVAWDAGRSPTPGAVAFRWPALSDTARAAFPKGSSGALINFLRGDRSGEDPISGFRVREGVLGDFVNGNPVFAQAQVDPTRKAFTGYLDYVKNVKSTRAAVLYAGANDGMLHAFKDTLGASPGQDGREIFAFVPRAVQGALSVLADRSYGSESNYHRFFVDGPLREADVFVPAPGSTQPSWRNYLIGSTGAGGRAVFALDITDPEALGPASVRWEIDDTEYPELGYVSFPVVTGRLADGNWVALFGNGLGGSGGQDVLFVVDLATGAVSRLPIGTAGANGLGGITPVVDSQGNISALYAGDLKGQLWKIEYDPAAPSRFRAPSTALFAGPAGQAIVQPPLVFVLPDGGRLLVVGTGRLITDADANDAGVQAVYGVREVSGAELPLTVANLATRTLSPITIPGTANGAQYFTLAGSDIDWNTQRGWRLDLTVAGLSGLRVIYPPQVANERMVFINAVSPAPNAEPCEQTSGKGLDLIFRVDTGLGSLLPTFDTNGDGEVSRTSGDLVAAGALSAADGVEALLREAPAPGGAAAPGAACAKVSIQSATGSVLACLENSPNAGLQVLDRLWRRIANPPIR